MQPEEYIIEGSLTVESRSLADNCIENGNLVEPGWNSEEDTRVIFKFSPSRKQP